MVLINKLKSIFRNTVNLFKVRKNDENEKYFINNIRNLYHFSEESNTKTDNYILVQVVQDYEFAVLFPIVAWVLKKKYNANIGLWVVRSKVESVYNKHWRLRLWNSIYNNIDGRWIRIFSVLGGKVLLKNTCEFHDQKLVKEQTAFFYNNFKSKEDVLKMEIEGVLIGDLIYDFYLRIADKPTVDIKDPFLKYLIEQTINIFYCASELFQKRPIKCVVTTYTTYIHHGIVARIALKRGVDVYALGNGSEFAIKIQSDYPYHSKNHTNYAKRFEKLTDKELKIEQARESFDKRFKGQIDPALHYMKTTGFSEYSGTGEKIFKDSKNKRVVVFLHCFFDSPHIYRDMLFPDFYEWLDFTLTVGEKSTDVDFYVKPHPNALPGNEEIVEFFKRKYPKIKFISKTVSNNQLISEGFSAAITVYGTLGHEYPYQGIPVVCAGDNPHASFNFCYQPKTVKEYAHLLNNIHELKIDSSAKNEILKFYYMHNLYKNNAVEKDVLELRSYKGNGGDSKMLVTFIDFFKNKKDVFKQKIELIDSGFNTK